MYQHFRLVKPPQISWPRYVVPFSPLKCFFFVGNVSQPPTFAMPSPSRQRVTESPRSPRSSPPCYESRWSAVDPLRWTLTTRSPWGRCGMVKWVNRLAHGKYLKTNQSDTAIIHHPFGNQIWHWKFQGEHRKLSTRIFWGYQKASAWSQLASTQV